MFFCESYKISKNTFFCWTPPADASAKLLIKWLQIWKIAFLAMEKTKVTLRNDKLHMIVAWRWRLIYLILQIKFEILSVLKKKPEDVTFFKAQIHKAVNIVFINWPLFQPKKRRNKQANKQRNTKTRPLWCGYHLTF